MKVNGQIFIKKIGTIIGILIIIILSAFSYQTYKQYQRDEQKRRLDGADKRWIMMTLGEEDLAWEYKKHSDEKSSDEKYYKLFLETEELPIRLEYFKNYMDENYPEVGYGSKYEEITMTRLKNEPLEVVKELDLLRDDLKKRKKHMQDIFTDARLEMQHDDSVYIMSVLGIGMDSKYQNTVYDRTIYKEFVGEPELKSRLEHLKTYVTKDYPDIGYGDKIEEITLEMVDIDPSGSKIELDKLIKELDKRGVDITDILKSGEPIE